MKKASMVIGSLMLASVGTAGVAHAADGEAAPAQGDSLAVRDLGAVALTGELGTESSPITSTATTSYIRTAVPIGCNHNGTLLRASAAKSKQPRKAAGGRVRRPRSGT
jgi:hypothetical protein